MANETRFPNGITGGNGTDLEIKSDTDIALYPTDHIWISQGTKLIFEGTAPDDFEIKLQATSVTADRNVILPDREGTLSLIEDFQDGGLDLNVKSLTISGAGDTSITAGGNLVLDAQNRVVIADTPFKLASMTQTERDAFIATNGDMIYNTTTNSFDVYEDGQWQVMGTVTIDNTKVSVSGDTMTGFLTLHSDPTANLHAATKQYVDAEVASVVDSAPAALDTLNELAAALGDDASFATTVTNNIATKVSKAGDTMTGLLTLSGDPTANLHAATKQYVDARETAITSAYQTYTDQAETDANTYTDTRETAITSAYQTADALKLNLTGGTLTGNLTINTASPTIHLNDTSDTGIDVALVSEGEAFYITEPEDTAGLQAPTGGKQWLKMADDTSGNIDILLSNSANSTNRVYHDGYHPTAISDVTGLQTALDAKVSTTVVSLGGWTITESGGTLYFATGGVNKMKIDASGNLTVTGDITAFGTV